MSASDWLELIVKYVQTANGGCGVPKNQLIRVMTATSSHNLQDQLQSLTDSPSTTRRQLILQALDNAQGRLQVSLYNAAVADSVVMPTDIDSLLQSQSLARLLIKLTKPTKLVKTQKQWSISQLLEMHMSKRNQPTGWLQLYNHLTQLHNLAAAGWVVIDAIYMTVRLSTFVTDRLATKGSSQRLLTSLFTGFTSRSGGGSSSSSSPAKDRTVNSDKIDDHIVIEQLQSLLRPGKQMRLADINSQLLERLQRTTILSTSQCKAALQSGQKFITDNINNGHLITNRQPLTVDSLITVNANSISNQQLSDYCDIILHLLSTNSVASNNISSSSSSSYFGSLDSLSLSSDNYDDSNILLANGMVSDNNYTLADCLVEVVRQTSLTFSWSNLDSLLSALQRLVCSGQVNFDLTGVSLGDGTVKSIN